MFYRLKEAGKTISADNLAKLQSIHDVTTDMGAGCDMPIWGGSYESARMMEAALPMTTSHSALHGHLRTALKAAHGVTGDSWSANGPWITDIFPEHVVYSHEGQMYMRKYTSTPGPAGSDPTISLGEAKACHAAYVPSKSKESMRILTDVPADWIEDKERFISKADRDKANSGDFAGKHRSFPILKPEDVDAALRSIGRAGSDNHDAAILKKNILAIAKRKGFAVPASDKREGVIITPEEGESEVTEGIVMEVVKESATSPLPKAIPVKLIGPGWGSCAYYSKEMLKRDGPEVFGAGTQMFWNHDTYQEQDQRPEGDLNNLAAVLTEAAHWEDSGVKGPGLYSKAKVFSDYATQVAEKGPHIGLSVNAFMKAHEGEIDGKSGLIADKFTRAKSVDFVTKAGAKGAPVVPTRESARGNSSEKETTMTEEEIKALQEANRKLLADKQTLESENAKLTGAKLKTEAVATISEALTRNDIPFSQKVLERLCENPQVKEGKLDQDWCKAVAKELAEAAGQDYGVQGLGDHTQEGDRRKTDDKELDAELKEAFTGLFSGMSEKGVEVALKGGR